MGWCGILRVIGAVALVRWAARKGAPEGAWRTRMLGRKPRMRVAAALANRMARRALMRKNEGCRGPSMATAQVKIIAISPRM
jgi:transposase